MLATVQITLNKEESEIIKTILYFDIFRYPLTVREVYENSAIHIPESEYQQYILRLLGAGLIKKRGEYLLSYSAGEADIERRQNGNKGAEEIMPVAREYARKVSSFPFVEGVYLSGSLSKNYYDERSDIDFFIITRPGRLWICRSFIILKYKLLPVSRRRFWCPNYFISSDNLSIPDINAFTGTELAFLIPVINYSLYRKLLDRNSWYKLRYPNKNAAGQWHCVQPARWGFKSLEFLFSGRLGDKIDNILLKFTLSRWRKKYSQMSDADFDLQFRSRKNVCKRHSHGFQNRVLIRWQEKAREFESVFNAVLGPVG